MKLRPKFVSYMLIIASVPLVLAMSVALWQSSSQTRALTIDIVQGYLDAGANDVGQPVHGCASSVRRLRAPRTALARASTVTATASASVSRPPLSPPSRAVMRSTSAVPTITASGLLVGIEVAAGADAAAARDGAIAAVFAFVAALLALVLMFRLLKSVSFTPYVIYRVIFGAILLFIAYT